MSTDIAKLVLLAKDNLVERYQHQLLNWEKSLWTQMVEIECRSILKKLGGVYEPKK